MEPPLDVLATLARCPDASLQESEVETLWSYVLPHLDGLSTLEGQAVDVADAGQIGNREGPDVQSSRVIIDGVEHEGDVEIHQQLADWYHHGHHRDVSFNNTVLHVVLTSREDQRVRRADGRWVPTVEVPLDRLDGSVDELVEDDRLIRRHRSVKRPCYSPDCSSARRKDQLERAGIAWYGGRVGELRRGTTGLAGELIESLGYSRNHRTFGRLARKLPLGSFIKWINRVEPNLMEAGLLGLGGWWDRMNDEVPSGLQSQRRIWEQDLQRWHQYRLTQPDWQRSGVRPQGFPARRWIGFGYLTRSIASRDWEIALESRGPEWFDSRSIRSAWFDWLAEHRRIPDNSFWSHHYTMSGEAHETVPSPLGKGWADVVLVNVILPYLSLKFPERSLLEPLRSFPAVLGNRRVRRVLKQFGCPDLELDNVLQQQGAVHLYKQGCEPGLCEECPLNQRQEQQMSLIPRPR